MRKRLQHVAEAVAAAVFGLLFLTFVVQVGMRFIFERPLAWSDELIVILYILIVFWSAATLLEEKDHVMLDLVYAALPPGGQRVFALVGAALTAGLLLVLLPQAWDYVKFMSRERTPVLDIPFSIVFAPFLLFIVLIAGALRRQVRAPARLGLEAATVEKRAMSFALTVLLLMLVATLLLRLPIGFGMLDQRGRLPARQAPGPRPRRRSGAERHVQRLHPARGAAVHLRGRRDELGYGERAAVRVRARDRRAAARRPRARQHHRERDLLRDERQRDRRRGRSRHRQHPPDAEERLLGGVRRCADGGVVDDRPDHPAVDPDGHLRARVERVGGRALPRRRDSRRHDGARADARRAVRRQEAQPAARGTARVARLSAHRLARTAAADAARRAARRHLFRRVHADRSGVGRRVVRTVPRRRRLSRARPEAPVRDPRRVVEGERVGDADHRVGIRHQLRVHRGERAGARRRLAHVDEPFAARVPRSP